VNKGYLRQTLYNLAADGWRRESVWRRQFRLLRLGTDPVVADPAVTVDLRDALVRLLVRDCRQADHQPYPVARGIQGNNPRQLLP
jgi:hypothetical protein